MLQRHARQVITAGKADETVADGGGPKGENSIFTGYLLEGLSGKAANHEGILTANGLMHFVYEKVAQDPRSSQTPHYGHIDGDGDFVLLSPSLDHLNLGIFSDKLVKDVEEHPELATESSGVARSFFATKLGYGDPEHANFGRNDLSTSLGEDRHSESSREVAGAFSWLAVIVEPTAFQSTCLDIAQLTQTIRDGHLHGEQPYEKLGLPMNDRTTFNSLVLYSEFYNTTLLSRYLRITNLGELEYAETGYLFSEYKGRRYFRFVQIVGLVWQVMFFYKCLLLKHNYKAGAHMTVSLVGTRETVLIDFSREAERGKQVWSDPLQDRWSAEDNFPKRKCTDKNIKMEYDFVVCNLNESEALKITKDIGDKLGLAYNHQSAPRCFNYDTDIFPWRQFISDRRY